MICPELLEDRTPITGRITLPEAFEDDGGRALASLGISAVDSGGVLMLCSGRANNGLFNPGRIVNLATGGASSRVPAASAGRDPFTGGSPSLAEPLPPAPPPPPPVMETVTLRHLQPAKALELAQTLCQGPTGCTAVQIPGQPMLAVRGASEAVLEVTDLLKVADIPQRSYRLRATLFEVEQSSGQVFGIEVQLGTSTFLDVQGGSEGAIRVGLDYSGALLSIRAQEDTGRATVLSRPEMRLTDGQPATFSSSVEVPTVSQILYDEAGRQTQGIEYREAGLILNVTLRASGSAVELDLGQELSAFAQQRSAVAGNPSKTKRSIRSTFSLPLGEAVMIGGLLRDTTDQGEGRIPVLGWPIRRNDQVSRTEVFLLVQVDQLAQPAAGEATDSGERPQGGTEAGATPQAMTP